MARSEDASEDREGPFIRSARLFWEGDLFQFPTVRLPKELQHTSAQEVTWCAAYSSSAACSSLKILPSSLLLLTTEVWRRSHPGTLRTHVQLVQIPSNSALFSRTYGTRGMDKSTCWRAARGALEATRPHPVLHSTTSPTLAKYPRGLLFT